jgi:16S rRNA (uracil1498-N3)-methyltransferase
MTRRRFYAPRAAFAPDEKSASLGAEEARHLRDVLRLRQGDEIYVFDGGGHEFNCEVKNIAKDSIDLTVIAEVEPACAESPLDLTLGIVLLKHEKFDLVIQKTTELGVSRIVPLDSERADVRLRDSEDTQKRVTRWRRIALEAAKQSGRARVPEVAAPTAFVSMLSAANNNQSSDGVARLMFAERGGKSLTEAIHSFSAPPAEIIALVGPEGGWTDEEIKLADEDGWGIVTLGGRTLRAETAAIVVATLLQHRFGDLS